jgi:hypothetical protein
VCAAWKAIEPTSRPLNPRKGLGVALAARLSEVGPESVLAVFRWYAGPTERATKLRAEFGLKTLTRPDNFAEYLSLASRPAAATMDPEEEPKAWAWVDKLVLKGARPPDPLHPDPRKARALRAAIDACGGLAAMARADEFTTRQNRATFRKTYLGAS